MGKRMRLLTGLFVLATVARAAGATEQHSNVLYEALINDGVTLSDGTSIKLPVPSLADAAGRGQQLEVLKQVAGRVPHDEFVRNSRTARFQMTLKSISDNAGKRTGQTIDVWFVAYGTLNAIEENELMEELSKLNLEKAGEEGNKLNRSLSAEELEKRHITVHAKDDELVDRYGYFEGPILDKVRVSGVTRTLLTRSDKSTLSAIALDDRFIGDQQFPNQWRSRKRNDLGKVVLGSAIPYSGFGGYVKVTELAEPSGALLVEMHIVFDEPEGWFGGRNLLRAKIPLAIKENVQTFRKKLQDLSK